MFAPFLENRKYALLVLFALLLSAWLVEGNAENSPEFDKHGLPYVKVKDGSNLKDDSNEAGEKHIPILMMFSMKHCPYCIEVEEDFLKPMLRNAEYENKVLIRKVRLDGNDVRDFNGKERDAGEFSEDYSVSMVPTIVLVNAKGKKLTKSIIGLANRHYYGGELDKAIDASLRKIRSVAIK